MILEYAPDDGEAEASAFFAGGDVRLKQPCATFLRQAYAVIDHVDDDVVIFLSGGDIDPALAEFFRRHRADRLGGVLDDIGHRLRNQPAFDIGPLRLLFNLGFDIDVGMTDTHQENGLPHGVGHVLAFDHRFGHPRELGEFVNHAADIIDLPHDGIGALIEHCAILDDGFADFALDALC